MGRRSRKPKGRVQFPLSNNRAQDSRTDELFLAVNRSEPTRPDAVAQTVERSSQDERSRAQVPLASTPKNQRSPHSIASPFHFYAQP